MRDPAAMVVVVGISADQVLDKIKTKVAQDVACYQHVASMLPGRNVF